MKSYISDTLLSENVQKEICVGNPTNDDPGSYVQAAIGDVSLLLVQLFGRERGEEKEGGREGSHV